MFGQLSGSDSTSGGSNPSMMRTFANKAFGLAKQATSKLFSNDATESKSELVDQKHSQSNQR